MHNLLKLLFFTLLIGLQAFIITLSYSKAQEPDAGGGQEGLSISQVEVLRMPPVDVPALLQEDQQQHRTMEPILRFAHPISVTVSPATHGTWDKPDAQTMRWRLRIISDDALSLNLGFSRYVMPTGGRLLLYTADSEQIVGPFTDQDNETHGQLWTPLLNSDDIVIEVNLPTPVVSDLELVLSSVNHGYVDINQATSPNKSGSCNVDVVCPEGDNWRDEIRSVANFTLNGIFTCNGALINNTNQDATPYFLTANHCGIDAANAPSLVFYWNHQTSVCGGTPDGSLSQFSSGAIFRASYALSDFALVELDDRISSAFNVYWAGWDSSGVDILNATTIHHPSNDEKRISFENDPPLITSYVITPTTPGDGSHIRIIDWDLGTTEFGSSGAPLFDSNKRVVGQLRGGFAACGNDLSDWYGRLAFSWDGGGTPSTRLKDWLDPSDSGLTTLDGRDYLFTYLPLLVKN